MADSKLDPNKSYGWTDKILRVNLTDKTVSVSPTDPYKEYLGGMGIANKIMYDEVPAGTDPLSPENKIVFAVGPLTATGVPLAGRTTIASLSTYTTDHQVVDAHTGGMIGAAIKKAGWDAIVIEGASDEPVYLKIDDDDIEIKPADQVWGQGTRATTEALSRKEGTDFCVATIGPAGENLLPYACIINSRNHSAGAGAAAVMGSKKLKALVVRGSQPIYVADPQEVANLSDYMLREIVGSNNNHVVPSTQQEWAEYFDKGSRWTAQKGLTWALAEGGPIDTGEPKPGEINTVGYRCMKAFKDEGPEAEKYTIKMDGCHSCPIHCYSDLRVPASAANGGYEITGNTCVPNFPFTNYMIKILGDNTSVEAGSEDALIWDQVFGSTMDDLACGATTGRSTATSPTAMLRACSRRCCPPRSTRKSIGRASRITTPPWCRPFWRRSPPTTRRSPTSATAPSSGPSVGTIQTGGTPPLPRSSTCAAGRCTMPMSASDRWACSITWSSTATI